MMKYCIVFGHDRSGDWMFYPCFFFKWQCLALPMRWRGTVRALFYWFHTFLDHTTNISIKVSAPRAPNDVPNCHLDKATMDNSSMHQFVKISTRSARQTRSASPTRWRSLTQARSSPQVMAPPTLEVELPEGWEWRVRAKEDVDEEVQESLLRLHFYWPLNIYLPPPPSHGRLCVLALRGGRGSCSIGQCFWFTYLIVELYFFPSRWDSDSYLL